MYHFVIAVLAALFCQPASTSALGDILGSRFVVLRQALAPVAAEREAT
jgi:hypothetical protein